MEVELAPRYRFWMLVLLPLSFGIGTLAMWVWARRWPRRLDEKGIRLRNGRLLSWADIKRLGVIEPPFSDETMCIDLYFHGGRSRVPLFFLANGTQIGDSIRSHFRRAKSSASV